VKEINLGNNDLACEYIKATMWNRIVALSERVIRWIWPLFLSRDASIHRITTIFPKTFWKSSWISEWVRWF